MARPNKRTRAKLKTQGQIQLVANLRNEMDDSRKLQQGRVASSVDRFTSTRADKYGNVLGNSLHTRAPRPMYEGLTAATPTRVQTRPVKMPDFPIKPNMGVSGQAEPSATMDTKPAIIRGAEHDRAIARRLVQLAREQGR